MEFTLYWQFGKCEVVTGDSIHDAMTHAGYGGGAVNALDFWSHGDVPTHAWDSTKKSWVKTTANRVVLTNGELEALVSLVDKAMNCGEITGGFAGETLESLRQAQGKLEHMFDQIEVEV